MRSPQLSCATARVSRSRDCFRLTTCGCVRSFHGSVPVPVLGALFSSMHYQKHETDLVIIVTPHLVQPAVPGQRLATPFDQRLPSNDADLFLMGPPEGR